MFHDFKTWLLCKTFIYVGAYFVKLRRFDPSAKTVSLGHILVSCGMVQVSADNVSVDGGQMVFLVSV